MKVYGIKSCDTVRRAMREPAAQVFGPEAGRYGLDRAYPEQLQARLEAEVGNGRPALIYALDAGGRSALVTPATFQAMEMHAIQKTYSKKFNAQCAAERARIGLDRIEVEKTPEGFIWREEAAAAAPAPAPVPRAKSRRPAAAKPAPEPKGRRRASSEALEADARAGKLPEAPDFSAATHARFRNKLDTSKNADLRRAC